MIGPAPGPVSDSRERQKDERTIRSNAERVNRLVGPTLRQDRDEKFRSMRAEQLMIGRFVFWTWLEGRNTVVLCDACDFSARDGDVSAIRRRLHAHAKKHHV